MTCGRPGIVERPTDLDVVDVDLRHLAVFDRVEAGGDNASEVTGGELVAIFPEQPRVKRADVHEAIAEGESRGVATIKPQANGILSRFIGQIDFGQQWFHRLWLVQLAGGVVTGNDSQSQRLAGIRAQERRIIWIDAIDGLGLEADVVVAVDGNTLRERVDRSIGTLVFVGANDVEEHEVFELGGATMNLIDFGLLREVVGEEPPAGLGLFRGDQRLVDGDLRGFQVTGEQMSGGDQGLTDVVQVMDGLILRELAGRVEDGGVEVQQVADRVAILAGIHPAQDAL